MKEKVAEPIEAQIVKTPEPVGPRAVMVSPATLRKQMQRDQEMREVINEYIANNMVEGKDYGSITVKGKESKPSLLKPGAEKFCGLFKIRPTFKKDTETVEMLGNTPGIIAYICELVDTSGNVIGEGRGSAKTDPKNGTDFDINKQVKIAEKRAQIDAVLRTGGLSDFFTQDMEDYPKQSGSQIEMASVKQIETIYKTVERLTGYQEKEDIENWLEKAAGVRTDKLGKKGAGAVISKLFDAERLKNEQDRIRANQPLDEIYPVDENQEINLDDIPF